MNADKTEDLVCGEITGVKIYDQFTDAEVTAIGNITDGMAIPYSDLPSNYYLVVETDSDIDDVDISVDGGSQNTEGVVPYTWPNDGENDNNWNGGVGSYTLNASAYDGSGSLCETITVDFNIIQACGNISGVKIYDQSTDAEVTAIGNITDGMAIPYSDLPSNYYLVVETDSDINEVDIELDGNTQNTEGVVPYTWPNDGENDNNWNGGVGSYTLDASAYDGSGNLCETVSIQFSITQDCGDITAVKIYDSSDNQPVDGIGALSEGMNVDVNDLPDNYYLNVLVSGGIESVEIELDGNSQNTENLAPYTWPNSGSNWNAGLGTYTIDASAYENDDYNGNICDQVNFTFHIVSGAVNANDDNVTITEDNTVDIAFLGNDDFGSDGPASDYVSIVTSPSHGSATINANGSGPSDDALHYVPVSNYAGTDQVVYEICDSNGNCDQATVTVTVESDCSNSETISNSVNDLPCLQNRHFTVQTKALLNASDLCMTVNDTSTVENIYVEVYAQESDCSGSLPSCLKISADGTVYKNPSKVDVIDHPNSGVAEAIYRVKFPGAFSQICVENDGNCNLSSMALYIDRQGGDDATGEVVLVDEELYDVSGEDYCIGNSFSINESGSTRDVSFSVPMHESTVQGAEYKMNIEGYDDEGTLVYEDTHTTTAPDASGMFLYTITRQIPGEVTTIDFSVCNPEGTTETIGIGMVGISSTNSCDMVPEIGQDESIDHVPGEPVTVDILGNDNDPDGYLQVNTVNIVSSPSGSTASDTDGDGDIDELIVPGQGTWTVDNQTGDITFTPEQGFNDSPDPLDYNVQDDNGNISDIGTVTVSYNQALPVILTYFKAEKVDDQSASVQWETSMEERFSHFSVERSKDGRNFHEIGRVQPKEHSRSAKTYEFLDEAPDKGINYYRLKMVDEDESFRYSDIESLVFDRSGQSAMLIAYPSPTEGHLTIEHPNINGGGQLMILNTLGKIVLEKDVYNKNANSIYREYLELRQLTSGTYRLLIIDGETMHSTTFLMRGRQ